MPEIPAELLTRGGPWGLIALVVVAILKGWLVPRSIVDDTRKDRDDWRAAYMDLQKARAAETAQLVPLVQEYAETTDAFIRSLPRPDRGESP